MDRDGCGVLLLTTPVETAQQDDDCDQRDDGQQDQQYDEYRRPHRPPA